MKDLGPLTIAPEARARLEGRSRRLLSAWLADAERMAPLLRSQEAVETVDRFFTRVGDSPSEHLAGEAVNTDDEGGLVLRLSIAVFDFFDKRSRLDDWRRLYAEPALPATSDPSAEAVRDLSSLLLSRVGIAIRMTDARNLAGLGRDALDEALRLAVSPGPRSEALANLSDLVRYLSSGRDGYGPALEFARLALQHAAGDSTRTAKALEQQGLTYQAFQEFDRAVPVYERALHLRRETGDVARIALASRYLAFSLARRKQPGDLERADELFTTARQLDRELQNTQGESSALGDHADLLLDLGRFEAARDKASDALSILTETRSLFRRGFAQNEGRLFLAHLNLEERDETLRWARRFCEHCDDLNESDRQNQGFEEGLLRLLSERPSHLPADKKALIRALCDQIRVDRAWVE